MPRPEYRLLVTAPAQRGLDRLPARSAAAIVEFMLGDLSAMPHRVGKELRGELAGARSARRGPYRVVYEIDDDAGLVVVLRIDHRAHAYRRA